MYPSQFHISFLQTLLKCGQMTFVFIVGIRLFRPKVDSPDGISPESTYRAKQPQFLLSAIPLQVLTYQTSGDLVRGGGGGGGEEEGGGLKPTSLILGSPLNFPGLTQISLNTFLMIDVSV